MVDIISQIKRSELMSKIRNKDTKPEKLVRSWLHKNGYRFRLYRRDLPGCPDIVLPKYKIAIFVHGCFWHRHKGCKKSYIPKSNVAFWIAKFEKNIARDNAVYEKLKKLDWKIIIIWQCELKNLDDIGPTILNEIGNSR